MSLNTILITFLIVLKSVVGKELLNEAFNVVPGGQTLSHTETWVST